MKVSNSLSKASLLGGATFFPLPLPRETLPALPLPLAATFFPLVAVTFPPLPPRLATALVTPPPLPRFTILPPRSRVLEALRPLLPTEAELKQKFRFISN